MSLSRKTVSTILKNAAHLKDLESASVTHVSDDSLTQMWNAGLEGFQLECGFRQGVGLR